MGHKTSLETCLDSLKAIANEEKNQLTFYDKDSGDKYDVKIQSKLYIETLKELAKGDRKMSMTEKTSFWMKYNQNAANGAKRSHRSKREGRHG